ncbi:DNA-directed RNA polymerase, partial [Tanacetum coccineum]
MPKMRSMTKQEQEDDNVKSANTSKSQGYIRRGAWQMWHRKGQRCPKGTVPVRRSTVHDVLRANSLYDFGKKQRSNVPFARRADAPDVVSGNGHE